MNGHRTGLEVRILVFCSVMRLRLTELLSTPENYGMGMGKPKIHTLVKSPR
jgi:hypothetical protein